MGDSKNGIHKDMAREFVAAAVDAIQDETLQEAITPAVRQIARELREIETMASDVQSVIADRVRDRLARLIQDEMRRAFAQTVDSVEETLISSILRERATRRPPTGHDRGPHYAVRLDDEPGPDERPSAHEWRAPRAVTTQRPSDPSPLWLVMEPEPKPQAARPAGHTAHDPAPAAGRVAMAERDAVAQAVAIVEAAAEAPADAADEEVYEGSVRLNVETSGCLRQVVSFVEDLRQKPQFRLFQLVGHRKEGADIFLGLREPTPLKKVLRQMPGVSQVSAPPARGSGSRESLLCVRLALNTAAS